MALNPNQSINGYRVDSRDKRSVKHSKELDYLLPKKGSQEALEELHDAVDRDNRKDIPERNCYKEESRYRDYDDPKNIYGIPSDLEARMMCHGCPLFDLCKTYAETGNVAFGVWAGVRYGDELIFEDD